MSTSIPFPDRLPRSSSSELQPTSELATGQNSQKTSWRRFNRRGELYISIAASTVIHFLFLALLAMILTEWFSQNQPPPVVDLLAVGDANPELASGGQSASDLEAMTAEVPQETITPPTELQTPELNQELDLAQVGEVGKELADLTQNWGQNLKGAAQSGPFKPKQSGTGTGQGTSGTDNNGVGGTGDGTSTGERLARWVIKYEPSHFRRPFDHVEQLGGSVGLIVGEDTNSMLLFDKPASNPRNVNKKQLAEENRMGWHEQPGMLPIARQHFKVPDCQAVLAFYPDEIEELLARIERDYKGLREDQIAYTEFELHYENNQYRFTVLEQRAR